VTVFYIATNAITRLAATRSGARYANPLSLLSISPSLHSNAERRAPLQIRRLCWHLGQRPSRRILRVAAKHSNSPPPAKMQGLVKQRVLRSEFAQSGSTDYRGRRLIRRAISPCELARQKFWRFFRHFSSQRV